MSKAEDYNDKLEIWCDSCEEFRHAYNAVDLGGECQECGNDLLESQEVEE